MYRGVFTVGVVVTRGTLFLANALTDRFYVNAKNHTTERAFVAHCLTGLGPSCNDNNNVLGGLYFNGNMLRTSCSSKVIYVKPKTGTAGVINIYQCGAFSTSVEGIYTCTMMNSSMMNQSVRFGVYFDGRSESLDLYILYIPLLDHLSSLNVAAPVMDTPSSSTVTAPIGTSLTLSCTSRGSPPDTFTWRKDNDPTILQSTSITAVDYNSTSAVFRAYYSIDRVTISDNGTYTCIVTNPIGNSNATIRVVGKLLITT